MAKAFIITEAAGRTALIPHHNINLVEVTASSHILIKTKDNTTTLYTVPFADIPSTDPQADKFVTLLHKFGVMPSESVIDIS